MRKKLLLAFILATMIRGQAYSQDQINPGTINRIDSLFQHIESTTPGYMIAIINDRDFLFEKGYGSANLEYKIPIDANSAFNVASLSKQFTGACIALLMLEGKYLWKMTSKHIFQTSHIIDTQLKSSI